MSMKKKSEQSILETVKESVEDLYDIGLVDATTLREFNAICLTPVESLSPRAIKSLRLRERVSQSVFALYLNISVSTVQQWERGDKHPSGIALKMLNLISRKGLQAIT